jgi:hypothetical protein
MSAGNEQFEREFEAFLRDEDARVAALYRKLPSQEPDARLDAAVRAMAHRALNPQLVATPRGIARRRGLARWIPAFGAAAGVVLAAGIAFKMGPSRNDREYDRTPASDVISVRSVDAPAAPAPPLSPAPPLQSSAAPAAAAAPSASSRQAAKMESMPAVSAIAKPNPMPTAVHDESAAADGGASYSSVAGSLNKVDKAASVPGRAQAVRTEERKRAMTEAEAIERRQIMAEGAWQDLHDRDARRDAQPGGMAPSGRDDNARMKSVVTESAAAPAVSTSGSPVAGAAGGTQPATASAPLRDESTAEPKPFDGYAATPAVPPPAEPAAPREVPLSTRAPAAATTATAPLPSRPAPAPVAAPQAALEFAPPPTRPAPPALSSAPERQSDAAGTALAATAEKKQDYLDRAQNGAAKQKSGPSKDPNASLYPEHWLANIRTMLRENRRDDAVRSLGEFSRMYPDYRLPADLRDLK